MKTTKDNIRLAEKSFDLAVNEVVRVVYNDEDRVYDIYEMQDAYLDLTDEALSEYGSDYQIGQDMDGKWYHTMLYQSYAGSYYQPPEYDYIESTESYETFDDALVALLSRYVHRIVVDNQIGIEFEKGYEELNVE